MILGGRRGGANPGPYQQGMAPDAQLYSGATATQWNGQRYTTARQRYERRDFDQFRRAFSIGMNIAGRRADVINGSWGSCEVRNGSGTIAIGLDGFANTDSSHALCYLCRQLRAGTGQGLVARRRLQQYVRRRLGTDPPYSRPAFFSSGGPNDYADPVNGTANDARQVVDIAAPGQNLSSAYYGGETGGNGTTDNPAVGGPGPTGPPSGPAGGPDFYTRGGLSWYQLRRPDRGWRRCVLYDAAYSVFSANDDARDARVMKAVLMNSADKTVGWDNAQITHPNGNGGVLTTAGTR